MCDVPMMDENTTGFRRASFQTKQRGQNTSKNIPKTIIDAVQEETYENDEDLDEKQQSQYGFNDDNLLGDEDLEGLINANLGD